MPNQLRKSNSFSKFEAEEYSSSLSSLRNQYCETIMPVGNQSVDTLRSNIHVSVRLMPVMGREIDNVFKTEKSSKRSQNKNLN